MLDLVNVALAGTRDLCNGIEGQSVEPFFHTEHQCANDGEGQRQAEPESRASSVGGFDLDGSFETREDALDDVESDAASGEFSDFLRGGEAGLEDKFERIALAEARGLFGFSSPCDRAR